MKQIATTVIAGLALAIGASTIASAAPLDAYRWKSRVLVVFSPEAGSPKTREQVRIVKANRAGYDERDLTVLNVSGRSVDTLLGPARNHPSAAALRSHYGVASNGFTVILVGKDGGAKMQERDPISATKLFATIDAMPMRRNEMAGN